MGKVKIPYYVVIKGRGYWRPKKEMRGLGFKIIRCGVDGPAAWEIAAEWNQKWQRVRRGQEQAPDLTYPRGSLGEAFERFQKTSVWANKAPRTREDWFRGWKYINPVFGDVAPSTTTLEHLDSWYAELLKVSIGEAYRAMKIWRALWKIAASMKYCLAAEDPSQGITRRTPASRTATWSDGEIVRLVKTAWRKGYNGLACVIAVAWDTQFSPVDVRGISRSNISERGGRMAFDLSRAKTGSAAIGTISPRTERLIDAYYAECPAEAHPNAPLFRNRSSAAYSKDTLGDDFRTIRKIVFPGDERKLMDTRRSGAVEAMAGGVKDSHLAAKMANTINQSKELQKTYMPVNLSAVYSADDARRVGRKLIRKNK